MISEFQGFSNRQKYAWQDQKVFYFGNWEAIYPFSLQICRFGVSTPIRINETCAPDPVQLWPSREASDGVDHVVTRTNWDYGEIAIHSAVERGVQTAAITFDKKYWTTAAYNRCDNVTW